MKATVAMSAVMKNNHTKKTLLKVTMPMMTTMTMFGRPAREQSITHLWSVIELFESRIHPSSKILLLHLVKLISSFFCWLQVFTAVDCTSLPQLTCSLS